MDFIQKTDFSFDIGKIVKDYNKIFPNIIDIYSNNQIALNSHKDLKDPYYDTAGRDDGSMGIDHPILNKVFCGTYFEEIFNTIEEFGRIRFMLIPPKKCYSIHADWEMRYHLAIKTHPQAFIIQRMGYTDQYTFHHIPADGNVYLIDTRYRHSAANFGDKDRIHLVFCINKTRVEWNPKQKVSHSAQ